MQMSFTIIVLLSLTECAAFRLCPHSDPFLHYHVWHSFLWAAPLKWLQSCIFPCVKWSEWPPFIYPVHRDAVLLFYLYPHASAPLRAPRCEIALLLFLSPSPVVTITECICCVPKMHFEPCLLTIQCLLFNLQQKVWRRNPSCLMAAPLQ